MHLRCFTVAAAVIAAALAAAAPLHADTIVVRSGTVEVPRPGPNPVSVAGDRGFTLIGRGSTSGRFDLLTRCWPIGCTPGETVSLEAIWSDRDVTGAATLDGSTYRLGEFNSVFLHFTGALVMPAAGAESAVVTAPFLFDGLFFNPFSTGLAGGGTVRARLAASTLVGDFRWVPEHTLFQFEDSLDPIPEPGTLGLLAVAGAFALRKYRRRRS